MQEEIARRCTRAALDVFFEWKSIYVDFSSRLQRAPIDTQRALHTARAGTRPALVVSAKPVETGLALRTGIES